MAEDYSYDSYSYSQPMSQPDYSYSSKLTVILSIREKYSF